MNYITQKLTKFEKRLVARFKAAKEYARAVASGFQLWQPGQVIVMSDRQYRVQLNGEWRRESLPVETKRRGFFGRFLEKAA